MKILTKLALLLTLATPGFHAQEQGYWRAASKTAGAITGDVAFSSTKFTINFYSTAIADIRDLKPEELTSVFDLDVANAGTGKLYRLSIPATKVMLHKNHLCGSDETQWIVAAVQGKTLQLAFFSGSAMPILTREAVSNSTDLCGTFTYVR